MCNDFKDDELSTIDHQLLDNPVFNALGSGNLALAQGTASARYFDAEVSPFAGFADDNPNGFTELHDLLPANRVILYATPHVLDATPQGWDLLHTVSGWQMVYNHASPPPPSTVGDGVLTPLSNQHIEQMLQLAELTKPGPFASKTIDFGGYYGVFDDHKQLMAMAGRRLHAGNCLEISAVCTHPNHTGKGLARHLMQHLIQQYLHEGKTPYLHVRADNLNAFALYQKLGFTTRSNMNFYVLKRG